MSLRAPQPALTGNCGTSQFGIRRAADVRRWSAAARRLAFLSAGSGGRGTVGADRTGPRYAPASQITAPRTRGHRIGDHE